VPPRLLWSNTVDHGARMALTGLNLKEISEPGTRSWTELPFGQARGLVGALKEGKLWHVLVAPARVAFSPP
jgi:hypothetical protein